MNDQQWMLAVLHRDNWTCRVPDCGANTHLDAAHIIPRPRAPQLRHDVRNGLTLCRGHHRWFHENPRQWELFTLVENNQCPP